MLKNKPKKNQAVPINNQQYNSQSYIGRNNNLQSSNLLKNQADSQLSYQPSKVNGNAPINAQR